MAIPWFHQFGIQLFLLLLGALNPLALLTCGHRWWVDAESHRRVDTDCERYSLVHSYIWHQMFNNNPKWEEYSNRIFLGLGYTWGLPKWCPSDASCLAGYLILSAWWFRALFILGVICLNANKTFFDILFSTYFVLLVVFF